MKRKTDAVRRRGRLEYFEPRSSRPLIGGSAAVPSLGSVEPKRAPTRCRRRDSNPRHADYDAAGLRLWSCVCGRDGARMGQRNRLAVASGRLHRQSQCIVACLPPGRRACLRRRSLWDVLNTTLGGAAPDSRGVQQPRRAGSIRRSGDASSVRRRRTNLTAARACAARVDIRKNWFAANGASS